MLFGRKQKNPITIADKGVVEWKYATCGYCSTGCSIEVGLDAEGEAVASRGLADADVNRGKLCVKGIFEHELFRKTAGRGDKPLMRDSHQDVFKEAFCLIFLGDKETAPDNNGQNGQGYRNKQVLPPCNNPQEFFYINLFRIRHLSVLLHGFYIKLKQTFLYNNNVAGLHRNILTHVSLHQLFCPDMYFYSPGAFT